ncbi:MAG: hypothetical protein M5R36_06680 [Deltaproteobacteria bacterium]|nr:hypothetical protein [Deltaproteobacteria bacterium]
MENAVVRIDGADTADLELRVTYRPNSQTAETVTVGAFSAAGTVAWTPQYAGITQLDAVPAAPDAKPVATKNVATRFDGFPLRGMIVMLLAGVILFGGMAWSIYVVYTKSPFVHEGSDHVLADD